MKPLRGGESNNISSECTSDDRGGHDQRREVGVTRFGMHSMQKKKLIRLYLSLFHPPSLLSPQKKPSTVTMEDVFEGAVGIDLGTTYSYVFPSLARFPS